MSDRTKKMQIRESLRDHASLGDAVVELSAGILEIMEARGRRDHQRSMLLLLIFILLGFLAGVLVTDGWKDRLDTREHRAQDLPLWRRSGVTEAERTGRERDFPNRWKLGPRPENSLPVPFWREYRQEEEPEFKQTAPEQVETPRPRRLPEPHDGVEDLAPLIRREPL